MTDIEGFILTGGASSRMGRDKAALRLGGRSFVERVAVALAQITVRTSLVSSRHVEEDFGLPVFPDLHANCGALGGLHSALVHARAPWVAVVSCDLPFVTAELLARLASFISERTDVVAPLQPDGRIQPLCSLYARAACLEACERLLSNNERRPRALLAEVRTRLVEFAEISDLKGSAFFFNNVNTPEEYEEASRLAV